MRELSTLMLSTITYVSSGMYTSIEVRYSITASTNPNCSDPKPGNFSYDKLFTGPSGAMIYVFSNILCILVAEKGVMVHWHADTAWRLFIVTQI